MFHTAHNRTFLKMAAVTGLTPSDIACTAPVSVPVRKERAFPKADMARQGRPGVPALTLAAMRRVPQLPVPSPAAMIPTFGHNNPRRLFMRSKSLWAFACILCTAGSCLTVLAQTDRSAPRLEIQKNGSQASLKGPAAWFTGDAWIDAPFKREAPSRLTGATVTFSPGARTAWHTHPLGQTLMVTSGKGWIQIQGRAVQEINAGDIVKVPANVKHWHGATPTTAMSHIALQEAIDGKNVEWMEKVSEEDYAAGQ